MTFDDRLRDALAREGTGVPSRSGDFDTVLRRGKRRKAVAFAAMSFVAVAVVAGSAGLAASLLGGDDGVPPPVADRTLVPPTGLTTTIPTDADTTLPPVTTVPLITTTTTMLRGPTTTTTAGSAVTTTTKLPPLLANEGCNLLGTGSEGENQLKAELQEWLVQTRPELADSGGRVSLSGRMSALNGWAIVPAKFTGAIFEPTMFVRSPSGDWVEAWSGVADAAELIRAEVADAVPDLQTALLDCADLFTFLEPSQATVLAADLVERASLGFDITSGGGFVWVATGLILEPGVETGEVLQIDNSTGLLIRAIDVTQPMSHVDYAGGLVWMVRAGDGALPDNLVGTVAPGTGAIELANIGAFSTVAMVADEDGMWLAQGNGWDPALMRIDRSLDIVSRTDLALGGLISDMVVVDGVAWLAMDGGRVARVSLDTGDVLGTTELGDLAVHLGVAADRSDPNGRAVWVLGDGAVNVLGSDGEVHTSYQIAADLCCVIANEASETVWLATWKGVVSFAGLDFGPTQAFRADGNQVYAGTEIGTALWTLGDSLTWILLGQ